MKRGKQWFHIRRNKIHPFLRSIREAYECRACRSNPQSEQISPFARSMTSAMVTLLLSPLLASACMTRCYVRMPKGKYPHKHSRANAHSDASQVDKTYSSTLQVIKPLERRANLGPGR